MSGLSCDHVKMSVDCIEDADGTHCGRLGGGQLLERLDSCWWNSWL